MTHHAHLFPTDASIARNANGPGAVEPSMLDLPSSASQQLLRDVRQLARHDSVSVCFVGPSGTGKSLYAAEIHRCSPRAAGPLVRLNIAGIKSAMAGSELLGHVEGAYTGARGRRLGGLLSANGGTLILDEVTKASQHVQHILLQLLDGDPIRPLGSDREVFYDVRFVALTSMPLDDALRRGALIPDLYERLKTFVLEIQPISRRRADLPAVLTAAVRHHARNFGYHLPPEIAGEIIAELEQWPLTGNHRELDGIAQRLLVKAEGAPILHCGHLPKMNGSTRSVGRTSIQRYLDDHAREIRPAFASVREEAKHYQVSVATIHRWRQQHRRA